MQNTSPNKAIRPKTLILLGILIGAFFLWVAIRDVDVPVLLKSLQGADYRYALPFVAALVVFYGLKAARWGVLLRPERTFSTGQLVAPMMIGFAGNNILPIRLGEILRIFLLSTEFRISKILVLATLLLERVFDAICILLLLALALFVSDLRSAELSTASIALSLITVIALIFVYVVSKPPARLRRFVEKLTQTKRGPMLVKIADGYARFRKGFASISSIKVALSVIANSLVQWLLLAMCVHLSFLALDIQVPILASLIVLSLIVVGISLPGAPGFVGTIEVCFVIGLEYFGVDPSIALAAAIYYHVLSFVFVTGAGFLFLGKYRRAIHTLRTSEE